MEALGWSDPKAQLIAVSFLQKVLRSFFEFLLAVFRSSASIMLDVKFVNSQVFKTLMTSQNSGRQFFGSRFFRFLGKICEKYPLIGALLKVLCAETMRRSRKDGK